MQYHSFAPVVRGVPSLLSGGGKKDKIFKFYSDREKMQGKLPEFSGRLVMKKKRMRSG
jgi:hypothetical protein